MAKQQFHKPNRRPERDDGMYHDNLPLPTSRPSTPTRDSSDDFLASLDEDLATSNAQNQAFRESAEKDDSQDVSNHGVLGDDDLEDAETTELSTKGSAAEAAEQSKLGKGFRKEPAKAGLRNAISNSKNFRKLGIAAGIVGLCITIAIAIFSFLLPFKLTAMIESIEQRVGDIPGYAVERRVEFYMNRYLMIRSLEATGAFDFSPGGADRDRFTYLGDSFWKTMYVNWKGAKLEETLVTKYGIKIRADVNPELFRSGATLRAQHFKIEIVDPEKAGSYGIREGPLNRTEVRNFSKIFTRSETRDVEIIDRTLNRYVLKKYFGVGNWKPFERQVDNAKNTYYEKKRAWQKNLIDQTVGRLSERYAAYMDCLLGSTTAKACRDTLKKADSDVSLPSGDEEDGRKTTSEIIDEATPENGTDKVTRRLIAGQISDKLAEFGIKKTTQQLVTSAAAGLGILDSLNNVYNTLDSGVLNQVIYDKNAQQYMAYTAPILSAADQIRSGEDLSIEDVRVAQETFDGFDESAVYQGGLSNYGSVSAAGGIYKDCNGNPDDGKETLLDPGETVCPDKRLVQDHTSFTDSQGWKTLGQILAPYDGTIGKIVGAINNAIGAVADATGLTSVVQSLADTFGISELAATAFGALLNRIAGPVITGAEVAGDAYDAVFAGITVLRSSLGGEVGVSKEDTIGGAYLTDKETEAIRSEQMSDYYNELEQKSFFARYFSPSVKESLTGQLAMHMPSSVGATSQQIASTLSNPFGIIGSLGRVFSPHAGAVTDPQVNPFHAVNMGYAQNHEIFTDNDGEGMNPDVLRAKYHCDLPVGDRLQNKAFGKPDNLPFEVPTDADPCLLEEAATKAGTSYFDGSFDEGISGPTASAAPTTSAGAKVEGDPTTETASVQCAAGTTDLGDEFVGHNDGTPIRLRLCAIPTITSSSLESQPGNLFSVPNANGKLIVNSRVSGAVLAMSQASANNGIVMKASSGWRSYEHQEQLWIQNGQNPRYAARPGTSNHEAGAAIDFDLSNGTKKNTTSCANKATSAGDPLWEWLVANAPRYGFGQYAAESWHWDATNSDRICR